MLFPIWNAVIEKLIRFCLNQLSYITGMWFPSPFGSRRWLQKWPRIALIYILYCQLPTFLLKQDLKRFLFNFEKKNNNKHTKTDKSTYFFLCFNVLLCIFDHCIFIRFLIKDFSIVKLFRLFCVAVLLEYCWSWVKYRTQSIWARPIDNLRLNNPLEIVLSKFHVSLYVIISRC